MKIPAPKPGLVIRYGFLWSREFDAGADEGAKDRPCAIVVAAPMGENADIRTVVAPITHSPPEDPLDSVEIPAAICATLGLDAGRHRVRLDELNRFAWPGFDIRPIPGRAGEIAYGMLPPALFEKVRQGILARQQAKRGRLLHRE